MEEIKESQPVSPLFTGGELKRLIIPLVIEQLLLMTVGMADTVMVTTAGEAAVSGISLVDSINLLLIQVFAALGTGGAVVVSQYLGRRDLDRACSAAKQLLYVITAVSLTLMALALLFRQSILAFLFGNIEPDVMENALVYFLLTALAYPFMSIYNVGAALFRSMGNSKVSMFNSLLVNMVNIAVNAILIYGFDMGAAGAGIGTLASRVVAAVIFMAMIRNPAHPVHIEGVLHFEFHWDTVKRILGISIPNGLENGMFQIGKLLVLSLITSFGTAATAANAIANSVASVVNVPGSAISLSLITVVGQCMGADDSRQAVAYTRKLMLAVYVSMGTLSAPCCSALPDRWSPCSTSARRPPSWPWRSCAGAPCFPPPSGPFPLPSPTPCGPPETPSSPWWSPCSPCGSSASASAICWPSSWTGGSWESGWPCLSTGSSVPWCS